LSTRRISDWSGRSASPGRIVRISTE
jgi:hypothetical protein